MKKTIFLLSFFLCMLATQSLSAQEYKNFRFTIGGGYAYWLGDEGYWGDKKLKDFNSDLRHGYNLDVEAQYFFHRFMGVGLNGNFVRYSNDEMKTMKMKETDKMTYVGATFNMRYINKKWGFYTGIGIGPMFYSAKVNLQGTDATIDKTMPAMSTNIACEYQVSSIMATGIKLAVTAGSFEIDGMSDRMSTSSFMITGFLSFKTR